MRIFYTLPFFRGVVVVVYKRNTDGQRRTSPLKARSQRRAGSSAAPLLTRDVTIYDHQGTFRPSAASVVSIGRGLRLQHLPGRRASLQRKTTCQERDEVHAENITEHSKTRQVSNSFGRSPRCRHSHWKEAVPDSKGFKTCHSRRPSLLQQRSWTRPL